MLPPAMRLLLSTYALAYLVWWVATVSAGARAFAMEYVALTPALPIPLFRPWQLLSYTLLDRIGLWGLIGFAFNMFWLYWMGRDYEETYGSHRLFGAFVLAALGGGALATLVGTAFGVPYPVVGALAPVLGVLCLVATLHPERGIGLLFLGVIPLKWVAGGFLALVTLFSLGHPPLIGAYFGAAAVGVAFARAQQRGTDLAAWARGFFPARAAFGGYAAPASSEGGMLERLEHWLSRRQKGGPAPRTATRPAPPRGARAAEEAPGPAELDRILDKISERGIESLTAEERRFLDGIGERDG